MGTQLIEKFMEVHSKVEWSNINYWFCGKRKKNLKVGNGIGNDRLYGQSYQKDSLDNEME